MKRVQAIVAVALCGASVSFAQKGNEADKDTPKTPAQDRAMTEATQDPCLVHKLGDVIGGDVRNPEDENLGEIEELVLNPSTGEIEYAVLSFGGFMGMGDKLFALPWDALESVHKADGDKKFFLLSVDKEKLKNSPGFPKDNWPDISSPEWSESIRKFYADVLRDRPSSSEVSGGKVIDANKRFNLVKATDLKGCDVDTSEGNDAGEISDLAIDPSRGRVAYIILAEGGFLGFGTDKYAVPWQACAISVDEDKDLVCKLSVPKSKFEKAPAFKDDDWKQMSDPVFVERVYTYYGYPIYWKGTVEAGSKG